MTSNIKRISGPTINDHHLMITGPTEQPITVELISPYGSIQSLYENVLIPLKLACDIGICKDAEIISTINTFFDKSIYC